MSEIKQTMQRLGTQARSASRAMAAADTRAKNGALLAILDAIDAGRDELTRANAKDLEAGRRKGLDAAMLDRLDGGDHG